MSAAAGVDWDRVRTFVSARLTPFFEAAWSRSEHGITVDFTRLTEECPDLSDLIIMDPERGISALESELLGYARARNNEYWEPKHPTARIMNLPWDTPIRRVRGAEVGRLLQVNGVVLSATAVQPRVATGVFQCTVCRLPSNRVSHPQTSQFLEYPTEKCPVCDKAKWDLVPDESRYQDTQWIKIQENADSLPAGEMPRSFRFLLEGEICWSARPGDVVRVTGILGVLMDEPNTRDRTLEPYIRVIDITVVNKEDRGVAINDRVENQIKELSTDPKIRSKIIESMEPSLYGLMLAKESVAVALFGGVTLDTISNHIRGDIHVLLMGDPGTGKSQLLGFAAKASPRGVVTTGTGSTAAGLTAAVVQEKGGGFALEAGALVLADKGHCMVDEIEKMKDDDRKAIHPAMEQQIIPISKAGIVTTLNARCSIIAAANPKLGRWNPYQTTVQNISLPVTILNRFDLPVVIRDIPDPASDRALVAHIMRTHTRQETHPPIELPLLRAYIVYARRLHPTLDYEGPAARRISAFYLQLRSGSSKEGGIEIAINSRQLESVIRISEANARMRLSEQVSVEDAENAIRLVTETLNLFGFDPETGTVDMDIFYTGKPKSLRHRMETVIEAIRKLRGADGAELADVRRELVDGGKLDGKQFDDAVKALETDGIIYKPSRGRGKVSLT